MTRICIRQPTYLPYLGFFKKIESSDLFVYLDDVQYSRGDWDNRNMIRDSKGSIWLTIPVFNKLGQKLNEVKICNEQQWQKKHIRTIKNNYQKAPFFSDYWPKMESIFEKKWNTLLDLNMAFIEWIKDELDLTTKCIFSSDLNIDEKSTKKLLEICKKLDASEYLSGEEGRNYLDETIFLENNIKVIYEKFQHPKYKQFHGKFISNLSTIDLLFNHGENSKEILHNSKNL